MLFGDKKKFAIEFRVNQKFYDEWIGWGYFVIYICRKRYGIKKNYATLLYCIYYTLKDSLDKEFGKTDLFYKYSEHEIFDVYFDKWYRDKKKCKSKNYNEIISLFKTIREENKFRIRWTVMESAFDDGSFVFQIREKNYIRLLATRVGKNAKMEKFRYTRITEEYFQKVVGEAVSEMKKYRGDAED